MELNSARIISIKAGELMRREDEIQKGAELRNALDRYSVAKLQGRCIVKQAQLSPGLDEESALMNKGDQLRLRS